MKVNSLIFKAYDIRGIYPKDLDKDVIYKIGRAFVYYIKAKKVIVGYDARLSSLSVFKYLIKGIVDQSADVLDIGMMPTECVYFAVGFYDCQGGIMITASHNPKEYNGFKMVKKNKGKIDFVRGRDMLKALEKSTFPRIEKEGKIKKLDIWQDYSERIFSFIDVKRIKPFKIIVDTGNGVAGIIIDKLKDKLPVSVISLNSKPDGNFPNRPPNPLLKGADKEIKNKILKEKADFGFMFDGDADRVFLVDEKGKLVRADISLLFLAKYFLENNPGAAIAYNLICSKAVPEFIKKWGGKPVRTPVGFVNVKEGLVKNKGIMGGELSGHYCFRDYFFFDSGFIAFLILLEIFSNSGKKVSQLVDELSIYAKSAEINFKVKNKEGVIDKIKQKYSGGKQDFLDGMTVEYDNWWFNVRPSNTEPLIRLTVECATKELLNKKKKELNDFIIKNK